MIRIVGLSGKRRYNWVLGKGIYTIGRSSQCDLPIEDDTVSRKHARVEIVDEQTINLTDLESYNGTTVNGREITGPARLRANDIIAFGRVEVKIIKDEASSIRDTSVNITNFEDSLTDVTLLPIEEALQPLPAQVAYDPKIFAAFSEMGKMLIIPGPEEEMFGTALRLLQEIIPAERVAIFHIKEQGEEVSLATCRTAGEGSSGLFNISQTVVRELLNRKNAILIPDVETEAKFAEQRSIIESRVKSAMAVPLFNEGKILGILYADTTNPAHHYTEDYLRITATFGNILAAKVANCHLLEERQAKELLESELAVASQIQEQLMPREFPHIEGYNLNAFQIQCKQVGGDLYDVAQLDDGRIIFMIADVSGKGMGAALLASDILASFRVLYSLKGFDLLDAICHVSKQLLRFTRPGDFASLFIGMLYPDTNIIRYVNAGHNPPMIVRGDGGVEYLEASGIPIGAMDIPVWKEETVQLEIDDLLFAFTDGIPEAIDRHDEQFGDERLEKFILSHLHQSPDELAESIIDEVDRFIGDIPRNDDITMMILRRKR